MSQLAYRPDIDGLRALAIIPVLIFHAFPALLPGGFVGVDIFFVISGYLITTIILKSLSEGTFTFFNFYQRRILRIFPALILVLIFVSTFAWLYFLANEFQNYSKHLASAMFFVSNITFFNEIGYFDGKAELKPLLHFWSLGIEEQFYILWPIILIFTFSKPRKFLFLTSLILVLSFSINKLRVRSEPDEIFFLLHGRFWELLIGGLLAYALNYKSIFSFTIATRNILASTGTTLILFAIFYLSKKNSFPGSWALLPTIGASLIVLAGYDAWVNRVILSRRWIVYIGLISYPLYLWHWPIISFLHIFQIQLSTINLACSLALSVLLAILTYEFIEKPLRRVNNKQLLTTTNNYINHSFCCSSSIRSSWLLPKNCSLSF
jgi:peptidoglycan/LPS O-acetylase OafA/YrhL